MSLRTAVRTFRGEHQFHVELIGRRRWWFLLSGLLVAVSIAGFVTQGLNLGIDFRGGALLQYPNEAGVSVEEVRREMARLGRADAIVQIVGGNEISVRTDALEEDREEILAALARQVGISPNQINIQEIGARWGAQISRKALQGLLIFLVVITIYLSLRFEWKMAIAAIVALFHDLIITAGIYALVGREVTPETVVAILTILGYSLYDTVVIFDKIKENTESLALVARETYGGAVNLSLNQVFMRSVNTSITTLLPIAALLFLGGDTLKNFAFALFIGVAIGTYSSIFVGAPVFSVLKEREPKFREIRARAERRVPRPALQAVQGRVDDEAPPEPEISATTAVSAPRAPSARPGAPPRRKATKKPRSAKKRRR